MFEAGVGALLVEAGSSLDYFTGVRWRRSERTTAAVIPARGRVVVVTPALRGALDPRDAAGRGRSARLERGREPVFARLAGALRDRGAVGKPLAVEETTRSFVAEGVQKAAGMAAVSGAGLVGACRLIKSPAELALMQLANDVTLAALRHVHGRVQAGMRAADLAGLMTRATTRPWAAGRSFALVLLNEASAYPHGSAQPQAVREGSVILMDCGCAVEGYQSDISRTWVFGAPTPRQRKVWATVKRGQEIALETARPGVAAGRDRRCGASLLRARGLGAGLPPAGPLAPHGPRHRAGTGTSRPISSTAMRRPWPPGMCFSDEPRPLHPR